MDKQRKFSKKALRDFELIDSAIKYNDQNAFSELMDNYRNSIYFTILDFFEYMSMYNPLGYISSPEE